MDFQAMIDATNDKNSYMRHNGICLLYTSDAADE